MAQHPHTHAERSATDGASYDELAREASSSEAVNDLAPSPENAAGISAGQNITQAIAEHLAGRIIAGDLAPGARIYELKVARDLNVSRGSVREALLLLERRLLIEIVPRRGAVVTTLSVEDVDDLLGALGVNERRWLSQAGAALSHGAGAKLNDAVTTMEAAAKLDDLDGVLAGHGAFYAALGADEGVFSAATFACLLPSTQRLLSEYVRVRSVDLRDISRYYRALLNAVEQDDGERLQELFAAYQKRMQQIARRVFV